MDKTRNRSITRRQLGFMTLGACIAATGLHAPKAQAAVPIIGGQGLTANAWNLATYIQNNYPGVQSIGGVRQDRLPDHPSGHALDLMVGGNAGLGNQIHADLMSNKNQWGIKYTLWQTANHFDHIHVTVH